MESVDGKYGKEYNRLRRLTSNLDVIQQSVGKLCRFVFLFFSLSVYQAEMKNLLLIS